MVSGRFFCAALLLACVPGCAGNQPKTPQKFGLESCAAKDMPYCEALANHTHRSWGPTQIEYISRDGDLHLWVGNQIVKGRWTVRPGLMIPVICYSYGASGAENCQQLSSEPKMKDASTSGDPFELASRAAPPFALDFSDRRSLEQLLSEARAAGAARAQSSAR